MQQRFKEEVHEDHAAESVEPAELPTNPRIMFLQGKLKEFRFRIDLVQSTKSRDHDLHK